MPSLCPIVTSRGDSRGDSRSDVQLSGGVEQITGRHDVIPIEDAARLVADQAHRHALRYSRAHEVPGRRAAEVVKEPARTPGLFARGLPGLADLLDALVRRVRAVKHVPAKRATFSRDIGTGRRFRYGETFV